MVTKGGYKLIDFGGVDISTSKTISGIYNKIADTGKRIVGCNITLGTTKFKELTLDVEEIKDGYRLSNTILNILIGDNDSVIGEYYTLDNSSNKKIYCHPVHILGNDTSSHLSISCLIFNNNETPFTFTTFIKYIKDLYGVVGETINIVATGLTLRTNDGLSNGNACIVSRIYCPSATLVQVGGLDVDGAINGVYSLEATFNSIEGAIFTDGVNAIN